MCKIILQRQACGCRYKERCHKTFYDTLGLIAKDDNDKKWPCHFQYGGAWYADPPQRCSWANENPHKDLTTCPNYGGPTCEEYCKVSEYELCDDCVDGACHDIELLN